MSRARALVDQPDLLVCALAAVLGAIAGAGALDSVPVLRAVVALPLVLFLPGYALVNGLFPSLDVPAVERLLLSVGSSIGMTILIGLVLGVSPIGLNPTAWSIALLTLTLALVVVAWLRRGRAGIVGARPRFATMPVRAAVMVLISTLVIANVVLGSRLLATQAQTEPPVQLWLIPVSGEHEAARLGMRAGPEGGEFHLAITSQGEVIHSFDLDLEPQETWETIVLFPEEIRALPIVARLYEGDSTTESRFVTLQPTTDGG